MCSTLTIGKKCCSFRSTNVTNIEDVPAEDFARDDYAAARGELRPWDRNLDEQAWKDPEHRILVALFGELLRSNEIFDGFSVHLLRAQGG